ncbi:hypothetical protein N8654_04360 [Synechococcus sp. AH-601-B19]|nr:hypothetical protein [Synechococcus sp. AH-601-B19]
MKLKFASHYLHNKLYEAYDLNQELWRATLYDFLCDKPREYGAEWTVESWELHYQRTLERVLDAHEAVEMYSLWMEGHWRKSWRYAVFAS